MLVGQKQLQELPEFDTDQIRFGHADVPNKTLFVAEIEKKILHQGICNHFQELQFSFHCAVFIFSSV